MAENIGKMFLNWLKMLEMRKIIPLLYIIPIGDFMMETRSVKRAILLEIYPKKQLFPNKSSFLPMKYVPI